MSSLLFAMVACFFTALGARDQLLVARLRERLGGSAGLLTVGVASSAVTAAFAAWAGAWISAMLSDSAASMFVALALALAGFELARPNRVGAIEEPTRSLGAIALVLLARQVTDGSRFLVLAIAAATALPALAGLGGAIGGAGAVALGWTMGSDIERLRLVTIRRVLAAILLLLAVVIGLSARGIIG